MAAITLVATVSNCFVPRLPGAHALRGILTETVFERSASVDIIRVSAGVTVTVESKQQAWTKQSLPQRYLCVGCPIKSDQAIRSLCLSEYVARCCDDTVDKKRVNSSVLKHLFLERVEQPKISSKTPGNALSDALIMSCFQNFAADAAKKKPRSAWFFETALCAILINSLINSSIRINSEPNILRSCFLH